jgi:hypothetical protein
MQTRQGGISASLMARCSHKVGPGVGVVLHAHADDQGEQRQQQRPPEQQVVPAVQVVPGPLAPARILSQKLPAAAVWSGVPTRALQCSGPKSRSAIEQR